ncbi:hypothetical protein HN371_17600 [Candidatus Poribacteria bacterium]|nr:hypothetical protein [Candidatus Poribacteria bacterium]MBT5532359.1 hypothetical protein [Candidatus Poribacteria bacterium]MBT7100200.1 hypothetical protein [Candidatus Poribacteria bacterium]MBT7808849.1 hypothetical protein [Candidatus Poribacteria bacterium]
MPRMLSVSSERMPTVILYARQEPDEASIVDALNNAYESLLAYGVQGADWELRRDGHGALRVTYGCSLPEARRQTFLVQWARVPEQT